MTRADVTELHYITDIANVPSILQHGILSHSQAVQYPHVSVAMPEIQERREKIQVPGGGPLHAYVNLYFDAHNPMLSAVRDRNDKICVLRVSPDVMNISKVIVTDRNAASWARFMPVDAGLGLLDRGRLFAQYWSGEEHKKLKCAEVLVPNRVEAQLVLSALVANPTALSSFQNLNCGLPVSISPSLFF